MTEKISTFAERLREGLTMRDMTQAELARATELDKSSISRYLKNEYRGNQDSVYRIAHALNVSEAWLMGYDVPMERENLVQLGQSIPPGFSPLPPMDRVPRVGAIACGTPILAEENIENYDSIPSDWRADFTLVCKGDSMEPQIQDGDVVAIRRQPEVETGEIAAVRIGTEATLKRVYYHEDYIELRPENSSYASIIRRREEMNDVIIEGRAVGFCRSF